MRLRGCGPLRRETKDITAAAASALAPLGLAVAPGPVPAAGAPEALPGSAVAGQPSITQPFAESPIAGVAEVPPARNTCCIGM